MSEEQLKAFIAKVQGDTSLQEQLKAEGADVVAIAKAAGFIITEAELKAGNNAGARELTDSELESVAGGAGDIDSVGYCTVPDQGCAMCWTA
ncbi:Nif11-like leader peptide family natural product precursor [Prochlorococcus sp. MIT 1201]|uniref:Nif11-like leader peptide family natural product precursor n=1 Tax=Prochlorococcus sp. MIT 1201 TaxID=3082535 RepID=UPI0039A6683A